VPSGLLAFRRWRGGVRSRSGAAHINAFSSQFAGYSRGEVGYDPPWIVATAGPGPRVIHPGPVALFLPLIRNPRLPALGPMRKVGLGAKFKLKRRV
jgi:hypothetical protein